MEQQHKNVDGYPTPFGQGYVINADTPEERRLEIDGRKDWPEFNILVDLNDALEAIYPNYVLIQLKMKFGRLCYYTQGVGDEGMKLIHQAEIDHTEVWKKFQTARGC